MASEQPIRVGSDCRVCELGRGTMPGVGTGAGTAVGAGIGVMRVRRLPRISYGGPTTRDDSKGMAASARPTVSSATVDSNSGIASTSETRRRALRPSNHTGDRERVFVSMKDEAHCRGVFIVGACSPSKGARCQGMHDVERCTGSRDARCRGTYDVGEAQLGLMESTLPRTPDVWR